MTPAQFALAVGADQMWIRNARRLLARPIPNDAVTAQWLGVVHDLHASLGIALERAARIANQVLGEETDRDVVEVSVGPSASLKVVVDRARLRMVHELRLARALYLPVLDQRGRPATSYRPIIVELERRVRRSDDARQVLRNMRRSPADRLASLGSLGELLVALTRADVRFIVIGEAAGALLGTLRQPAAVDLLHDAENHDSLVALASVLDGCHAVPRGGTGGESFPLDAPIIGSIPALALDTDLGALNLWTRCHVIGDHRGALTEAFDSSRSGFPFAVLGPQALMAMERGSGRARDNDRLFELRQVGIEHQRAARFERHRRSGSSSSAFTLP